MSTGWLTWATLMLATSVPAAPGDDVVHINQRGFQIPIRVLPERQHEVRELLLYLSRDQGKTWEIYSRATPDRKGFDFYTQTDGLFYFSIAVIDRAGQQDPKDIYRARVGQKIRIDTTKPAAKLATVERAGDEVQVQWTIQEDCARPRERQAGVQGRRRAGAVDAAGHRVRHQRPAALQAGAGGTGEGATVDARPGRQRGQR